MSTGQKKSSSHHKSDSKGKGEQKLRIIGGRWRGRVLPFPCVDGLRPTGNRVRETLFNWLMPELPDRRCLDLFAGSGALGFEALSRGASECTFVELNLEAVRQLRANAATLSCHAAHVEHVNALTYLQSGTTRLFDLVFIDPPFAQELWLPVMNLMAPWLANDALVYSEAPKGKSLSWPLGWTLYRQKEAGQVCYSLHRFETSPVPF